MTKKRRHQKDMGEPIATGEGPPGDREMSFWEHLEELRARLIRSFLYIALGSVVGWIYYQPILNWVTHPVAPTLKAMKVPVLVFQNVAEPFLLRLQVSVAAGIVIAFPFVLYEVLAFIWPALYPHEKRFVLRLVPFSLLLFVLGVATVYGLLPPAFLWLLSFTPKEPPSLLLNFGRQYIWLVVKLISDGADVPDAVGADVSGAFGLGVGEGVVALLAARRHRYLHRRRHHHADLGPHQHDPLGNAHRRALLFERCLGDAGAKVAHRETISPKEVEADEVSGLLGRWVEFALCLGAGGGDALLHHGARDGWDGRRLGHRGRTTHPDEPIGDGNFLRPHHHLAGCRFPRHCLPDGFLVQDVNWMSK
jgi:Tat protein translocase TatC